MGKSIIKRPASPQHQIALVGLALSLTTGTLGYLSQKDTIVKASGLGLAVSAMTWVLSKPEDRSSNPDPVSVLDPNLDSDPTPDLDPNLDPDSTPSLDSVPTADPNSDSLPASWVPHLTLPLEPGVEIGQYCVGNRVARLSGSSYQVFTARDVKNSTRTYLLFCYQFPSQQQNLFNQYLSQCLQQAHTIQKGMRESLLLQIEPIYNVMAFRAEDNHKSYGHLD